VAANGAAQLAFCRDEILFQLRLSSPDYGSLTGAALEEKTFPILIQLGQNIFMRLPSA